MKRRLKLRLAHGAFNVLASSDEVGTCYTDYAGTSRTTVCPPDELIEFAKQVLETYGASQTISHIPHENMDSVAQP